MNEWQLTRYLIDAKKCIDSLLYIDKNIDSISNLNIYEIIEAKLRHFYINLCILLDNGLSSTILKNLKKEDDIIKNIYYERDKNYAHKDINYERKELDNRKSLICKLQKEIEYCFKVCEEKLPKCITINYVSYDKNLFRFANQISPILEKELKNVLYSNNNLINGENYKVFNDTEEIKNVANNNEYAVIIENGLTLKEGLQNRQDSCIKINVLYNLNTWCTISQKDENILEINEKDFIATLNVIKNR
ncbi:MAG: hypothetical protein Q4E69_06705 [Bacilli bacterium]|nr:hypothetical protein [Bacilli bacterium]